MRLVINRKGKLTENRMLLIIEKMDSDIIEVGEAWAVVGRTYFYEGQTSVPLWPRQQCCWADECDLMRREYEI